jgi:hypothetical protein
MRIQIGRSVHRDAGYAQSTDLVDVACQVDGCREYAHTRVDRHCLTAHTDGGLVIAPRLEWSWYGQVVAAESGANHLKLPLDHCGQWIDRFQLLGMKDPGIVSGLPSPIACVGGDALLSQPLGTSEVDLKFASPVFLVAISATALSRTSSGVSSIHEKAILGLRAASVRPAFMDKSTTKGLHRGLAFAALDGRVASIVGPALFSFADCSFLQGWPSGIALPHSCSLMRGRVESRMARHEVTGDGNEIIGELLRRSMKLRACQRWRRQACRPDRPPRARRRSCQKKVFQELDAKASESVSVKHGNLLNQSREAVVRSGD